MTARLEVAGVTVRFGGNVALREVGFTAEDGQVTGIIGPNGAGKTTLFNVVSGLQRPERGEVRLDGRDLGRLSPHRRARLGLARTFQRLELFTLLTVRENVELAITRHRRQPDLGADAILSRLGLGDVADVRADELPTGTARLVELARALATGPRVLLLDEPAAGQDERETELFRHALTEVAASGVAAVLVEHDVDLVMRSCDRVVVLDYGAVLAVGTPAEIQADPAVRAAYLGPARSGARP